ncbi:MAG: hypothetical protein LBI02_12320 [Opitutaceae bacterium]|jgi:hypothetical protein|nr:hypothetical protein [Opitutaceae bacterium]
MGKAERGCGGALPRPSTFAEECRGGCQAFRFARNGEILNLFLIGKEYYAEFSRVLLAGQTAVVKKRSSPLEVRRWLMEAPGLCAGPRCPTRFTRSGIILDISWFLLNGVVLKMKRKRKEGVT